MVCERVGKGGRSQRVSDAVVVFVRLDSSRLPGKALLPIAGKLLIDRVIGRTLKTPGSPTVVVATSDRPTDDPIVNHLENQGVPVFRGAAQDVAGRALACAEAYGLERFVRISGDSPFIAPDLIAACLTRSRESGADLVTNVFPRGYPVGVSVEAITTATMRRIVYEIEDPEDAEHVTRYAYRESGRFHIENLAPPDGRYAGVSLAVDTPRDHQRAGWIFETHGDDLDLDTAVAAAREWETREREKKQ
jgi:spore coat polysaccharide biosynthesis protein SpsF